MAWFGAVGGHMIPTPHSPFPFWPSRLHAEIRIWCELEVAPTLHFFFFLCVGHPLKNHTKPKQSTIDFGGT